MKSWRSLLKKEALRRGGLVQETVGGTIWPGTVGEPAKMRKEYPKNAKRDIRITKEAYPNERDQGVDANKKKKR